MLMDKYVRQRQERARAHLNENQREGSPYYGREHWVRYNQRAMTWQKIVGAQASQKARAEDPRLFYGCEGWSRQELSSSSGPREDKWNDDVVMVGSVPCKLQSIIYMGGGGQRVIRAGPAQEGQVTAEARSDWEMHEEPVAKHAGVVSVEGR
jgi:hypothetical protein